MTRPEPEPVVRYRLRPRIALATCATVPLLCAIPFVLFVQPFAAAIPVALVVAVAVGVLPYRRVRRRTLTVTEAGLVAQRDDYRLVVPWAGISRVQRRTHQGILRVDELICTETTLEPVDSRGRTRQLPSKLADHPALSRVMVSLYCRTWREGPIGDHVRALGG